jgi:hypothetical protein
VSTVSELPADVFAVLAETSTGITGVVATVDPGGRPHTAPFGSLWAPSPKRLRFGCDRGHATFENLRRDARVAVCLVTPPDIAVTVFGGGTVVREAMEGLPSDAVVEIQIEEVKNDMFPGTTIETGVTYSFPPNAIEFIERYMTEIRRA